MRLFTAGGERGDSRAEQQACKSDSCG